MIDHDCLFKELLTTFFVEFLELFYPSVLEYLDTDSLEFLDKELFTDVSQGETHLVDIIAKARFRGSATCFLIHVENQAKVQSFFARRMFGYCSRLMDTYDSMSIRLRSSPSMIRNVLSQIHSRWSSPISRCWISGL